MVRAVDALSLSIERGQTLALVGESGCGKSMTALSILRLLPQNGRVSHGTVKLQDLDVAALPESRMRDIRGRRISMIFQEPASSLNPVQTAGQQIVEVLERHTDARGAQAKAQALQWLHRVGLPEPEHCWQKYPFQLSGGQKQRVMIAIALAAEPDLVIADEPTTALDVTIQAQILDLLKDLQASLKMAILLITHDLAVVSQMAHRVALMYAGQIIETAKAQDFFLSPCIPTPLLCLRHCLTSASVARLCYPSPAPFQHSTRLLPPAALQSVAPRCRTPAVRPLPHWLNTNQTTGCAARSMPMAMAIEQTRLPPSPFPSSRLQQAPKLHCRCNTQMQSRCWW